MMVQNFLKNEKGNFGIIFGLSLLPILSVLGAAIDYSAMLSQKSKIQSAADIALIAAARDSKSENDFFRLTENYLTANLMDINLDIVPKTSPNHVKVTVSNQYNTAFLALVGIPKLKIEVASEVAIRKFGRGSAQANLTEKAQDEVLQAIANAEKASLRQLAHMPPRKLERARIGIKKYFAQLRHQAKIDHLARPLHISK